MIELTDNSVNSCYKYTPQAQGCKGIYGHTQKSIRKYKKDLTELLKYKLKYIKLKYHRQKICCIISVLELEDQLTFSKEALFPIGHRPQHF